MARAASKAAPAEARPIKIFYYLGSYVSIPDERTYSRRSRAATVHGAVRASVRHILDGNARWTVVYDADDRPAVHVLRRGRSITIWGSGLIFHA